MVEGQHSKDRRPGEEGGGQHSKDGVLPATARGETTMQTVEPDTNTELSHTLTGDDDPVLRAS